MDLGQLGRYGLVGGAGTLVHLGLMALVVECLDWHPVAGAVVGFIGALLTSYILNHAWTFQSRRAHGESFWRFVVVSLFGLWLNAGMMYGLVHFFGMWYLWAQLSVVFVVPITNFLLNRCWTFAEPK